MNTTTTFLMGYYNVHIRQDVDNFGYLSTIEVNARYGTHVFRKTNLASG